MTSAWVAADQIDVDNLMLYGLGNAVPSIVNGPAEPIVNDPGQASLLSLEVQRPLGFGIDPIACTGTATPDGQKTVAIDPAAENLAFILPSSAVGKGADTHSIKKMLPTTRWRSRSPA